MRLTRKDITETNINDSVFNVTEIYGEDGEVFKYIVLEGIIAKETFERNDSYIIVNSGAYDSLDMTTSVYTTYEEARATCDAWNKELAEELKEL